jgi:6-phospho-beta-glucosidase
MIPNYYLQYFYDTPHKLAAQEKWPPSRADEVIEIEKSLLREYADPARQDPPADLMKRGGAYYSTVATQLLNAHYNDLGETHIVNTRNDGAVKEWPADWVLELPARVDRRGIHPLPAEPLPPACFGLIAQIKSYELLTVEAAVRRPRAAAGALAHPLGPKVTRCSYPDDMLKHTGTYRFCKFYDPLLSWYRPRWDENPRSHRRPGRPGDWVWGGRAGQSPEHWLQGDVPDHANWRGPGAAKSQINH